MSAEVQGPPEPSTLTLVSGILVDLEHLVEQQLQLTRREIEAELRQSSVAAAIFALGAGILFLALILLCLAGVHLLHLMTSPAGTDPARIPLWACHGIVASLLAVAGGVLIQIARIRFRSVPQCQDPLTEILEEPV
jgi:hypothetical protein